METIRPKAGTGIIKTQGLLRMANIIINIKQIIIIIKNINNLEHPSGSSKIFSEKLIAGSEGLLKFSFPSSLANSLIIKTTSQLH
jgi:hypothetical protein